MKIYISGSISKNPDYKEQFRKAEANLKLAGYEVINPIKNRGKSYKELIDKGLLQLMECDTICLLPGFEESTGAMLELEYAKAVELKIMYMEDLNDMSKLKNIDLNNLTVLAAKAGEKIELPEAIKSAECLIANIADGINIPVNEYLRLKDIETRFAILKEQMLRADYCPIHQQVILGITQEYEQKQKLNMDMFSQK